MSPADAVSKTLATVPLNYTPNAGHMYSNFGFLVLGRLVSDISGVEYEDYVQNDVLSPVG
jgi:CubicO group peptidase (beta-lactamase class C family)